MTDTHTLPPALILAGGLGTRLRPLVGDLPKPMAPIAGRPFLEYQIDVLVAQGITDVMLCVGYRYDLIQDHFGDGSRFGARITYSIETEPLGTGGALRLAAGALRSRPNPPDLFLALNGDTYFDGHLAELIQAQQQRGAWTTIGLAHKSDAGRYGAVTLAADGRIVQFAEKSTSSPGLINAGVYACSLEAIHRLPAQTPLSLEHDVFVAWARQGQLRGHIMDGYNIDIGTPEGFREFEAWALHHKPSRRPILPH